MINLVSINLVHASDYNPRKADERRLQLMELSIKKLGFLLPIYADVSGEILSGHQRYEIAKRMGFEKIPVFYVNKSELSERKALNLLFNRATNDLKKTDTSRVVTSKLYHLDVEAMSAQLPDIVPGSSESFPCIYSLKRADTMVLAKKNHRNFDTHVYFLARSLKRATGGMMPIVITPDMEVVNGIGRLQAAVDEKRKFVRCVQVTEEQKEFAAAMLNLLSMDFNIDINSPYADNLRYNSFMRTRMTKKSDDKGNCALCDGFFRGIWPEATGTDFYTLEGKNLKIWKEYYGDKIVDFGAGKLNAARTLKKGGIFVSSFEPYFATKGDEIHKNKSIEICERFLLEVASGISYTSVFIANVFNSVPFIEDRKKVAAIAAALCWPNGKVICYCQSEKSSQFRAVRKCSAVNDSCLSFALDYEPNTIIGELSRKPKVQKGHTDKELLEIFSPCFKHIRRLDYIHEYWYLEADSPIINPERLVEAIDFEFNLPYPDDTRAGLNVMAREVFEKRLGIKLP